MRPSRSTGLLVFLVAVIAGCTEGETGSRTTSAARQGTSTSVGDRPEVVSASVVSGANRAYSVVELTVVIEAEYDNPFDQREVSLDALITGPGNEILELPGFWDGVDAWRFRFTPSAPGTWSYSIAATDHRGESELVDGAVSVGPSDHPGFLRVGDQVDESYSPRYFAYEDGTPWYGRGHADLDMSLGGPAADGDGLRKFSEMSESGENYEMWWPMWGNNFIQASHENYAPAQLGIIDFVVRDAEAKGIALVYTIWGHQFLRTAGHDWPDDRWNFNGFSDLTSIEDFFTDPEAWAWQENYYRYIIARWSYSPAILMWQTVTEINGTESYAHTDTWHEKVNSYFQENDPFRHPTTATKSGAEDWPEGHAVMDVTQVHLYHIFGDNPIADGARFADWTTLMWERAEKPNWIGEYGNRVQALYPEFMHNANWASLATGAAMTPTEWNDLNAFGSFDEEMGADMRRFADFVEEVPLVTYDPDRVDVDTSDPDVRGWGVVGQGGGVLWLQDFALETSSIERIRDDQTVRSGMVLTVSPVAAGLWTIRPYDTWTGDWLETIQADCPGGPCDISVPDFNSDVALHLERGQAP